MHRIERMKITLEGILGADGTWTKILTVHDVSVRDPKAVAPFTRSLIRVPVVAPPADDARTEDVLFTDCLSAADAAAGI